MGARGSGSPQTFSVATRILTATFPRPTVRDPASRSPEARRPRSRLMTTAIRLPAAPQRCATRVWPGSARSSAGRCTSPSDGLETRHGNEFPLVDTRIGNRAKRHLGGNEAWYASARHLPATAPSGLAAHPQLRRQSGEGCKEDTMEINTGTIASEPEVAGVDDIPRYARNFALHPRPRPTFPARATPPRRASGLRRGSRQTPSAASGAGQELRRVSVRRVLSADALTISCRGREPSG